MSIDPATVLNRVIDDDLVQQLLREAGPASLYEGVDDETFYEFFDHGFSLRTDENRRICTIHYYLTPVEEYKRFTGTLPQELNPGLSRREIAARLGVPAVTGSGASPMDGKPVHWIRYDYPTHSVHVQFSKDDHPELVTMMTPDALP